MIDLTLGLTRLSMDTCLDPNAVFSWKPIDHRRHNVTWRGMALRAPWFVTSTDRPIHSSIELDDFQGSMFSRASFHEHFGVNANNFSTSIQISRTNPAMDIMASHLDRGDARASGSGCIRNTHSAPVQGGSRTTVYIKSRMSLQRQGIGHRSNPTFLGVPFQVRTARTDCLTH